MKTYSAKPQEITRKWWIIDATDLVAGRVASQAAKLLRGKHKPYFTPHLDCGDHVVIVNAEKVHLTGTKLGDKTYYRHTGYPGGVRSTTPKKILASKAPEDMLKKAVQRMISRNPLGRKQMGKLHVYAGETHPHEGQKPEALDIAALNPKNVKRAV